MTARPRRLDIAVLRFLCITVVVFFHAYGMMYAPHFSPDVLQLYASVYEKLNSGPAINIAMPMFVFISGFLFGAQLARGRYSFTLMGGGISLFKNKFMRLILPFFVFTVLFMLTTNSVSAEPFYRWTYSHLWFLPMLFWCFILTWVLQPLIFSKNKVVPLVLLGVLLVVSTFPKFIPMVFGLHNVSVWAYWFVLGAVVCRWEEPIFTAVSRYRLACTLTLLYIVLTAYFYPVYAHPTIVGQVATTAALLVIWHICRLIPWHNYRLTAALVWLSSLSFGIYIFHNWLEAYMISRTAQRVMPLHDWALDHHVLFPLAFSLLALSFSTALTWLCMRTRAGRYLIG